MISTATRQPGGFTTAELKLIDALVPHMARLTDIQALSFLATTLLDTYVGKDAGGRIMTGNIRRGSTETDPRRDLAVRSARIHPVERHSAQGRAWWLCSTTISIASARRCSERGGEILKFIGDAMLAIFRFEDESSGRTKACAKALTARK